MPLYFGCHGMAQGLRHRVRVLGHLVLPPGDARGVDRVRHRVLPPPVVERVGEVRPGLGDVRDVAVVERLDQLGLDQLAEHVHGRAHEHVEAPGRCAASTCASFMVLNVVTWTLQLYFLAKSFRHGLVDVGDPVVDLQRGALSPAAGRWLDRLVVLEDRPGHRVVRPGQRRRRAACLASAGRARGEQRAEPPSAAARRPRSARKPRRDSQGCAGPSSASLLADASVAYLSSGGRSGSTAAMPWTLTEHSVNKSGTTTPVAVQAQAPPGKTLGPCSRNLTGQPGRSAVTAAANAAKFATSRSMSASSCCTEISHCSILPHGGRKTPPLCWKSQCAWL